MSDEVDHVDNFSRVCVDEGFVPRLVVSDLNDVGQRGVIGVLEDVFSLNGESIVLFIQKDVR